MELHTDEFTLDLGLVHRLLAEQMPQWSDLPVRPLTTTGTVNRLYRLGHDKVLRFPRTKDFASGPVRESRWMPVIAPVVPLIVPDHLALGTPTDAYPSHWSVLEWIEGESASRENLSTLDDAARALGAFVRAMRRVPIDGAPNQGSYRAQGLWRVDADFRRWVAQQPDDIDRGSLLDVWARCLDAGAWTGRPSWLHSDLRGDNLIARGGELLAVIDWEGCSVGDPSADLLAAWWLFDGDSRETFRSASRARHPEWMRAKGWALLMAAAAIPYYERTNPAFVAQARAAIDEILADDA